MVWKGGASLGLDGFLLAKARLASSCSIWLITGFIGFAVFHAHGVHTGVVLWKPVIEEDLNRLPDL